MQIPFLFGLSTPSSIPPSNAAKTTKSTSSALFTTLVPQGGRIIAIHLDQTTKAVHKTMYSTRVYFFCGQTNVKQTTYSTFCVPRLNAIGQSLWNRVCCDGRTVNLVRIHGYGYHIYTIRNGVKPGIWIRRMCCMINCGEREIMLMQSYGEFGMRRGVRWWDG